MGVPWQEVRPLCYERGRAQAPHTATTAMGTPGCSLLLALALLVSRDAASRKVRAALEPSLAVPIRAVLPRVQGGGEGLHTLAVPSLWCTGNGQGAACSRCAF